MLLYGVAIPDRNVRLGELKGRLKALPGCNIDTLQFLIEHLRRYISSLLVLCSATFPIAQ